MKPFIHFILIFLFIFSNSYILAAEDNLDSTKFSSSSPEKLIKRLYQGSWILGGSFSYSSSSLVGSTFSSQINLKHFFIDMLALGLGVKYQSSKFIDSQLSIGPTVNYFFWESDELAADFGQEIFFKSTNSLENIRYFGESSLGLSYFINSNVAVGIRAFYFYIIDGDDPGSEFPYVGTNFSFSFYL